MPALLNSRSRRPKRCAHGVEEGRDRGFVARRRRARPARARRGGAGGVDGGLQRVGTAADQGHRPAVVQQAEGAGAADAAAGAGDEGDSSFMMSGRPWRSRRLCAGASATPGARRQHIAIARTRRRARRSRRCRGALRIPWMREAAARRVATLRSASHGKLHPGHPLHRRRRPRAFPRGAARAHRRQARRRGCRRCGPAAATSCARARWAFAATSTAPSTRSGSSSCAGRWRSDCRTAARACSGPGSTSTRPTCCPPAPRFDAGVHGHRSRQVGDEALVTLFVRG